MMQKQWTVRRRRSSELLPLEPIIWRETEPKSCTLSKIWKKLKRLGRYLKGNARVAMECPWQGEEKKIVGYSDSDWAGCRVTGKSASGGALMIGSHLIKAWSRTQNNVTLSSAEAELNAMVKCTAELLGTKSMMADWGRDKKGTLYADSSAALGIANRKGAGHLRHININTLWVQEVQDRQGVTYQKVLGTENPADLMTKYLTRDVINGHMERLGQEVRGGRAENGLEMQGTSRGMSGGDDSNVEVA